MKTVDAGGGGGGEKRRTVGADLMKCTKVYQSVKR